MIPTPSWPGTNGGVGLTRQSAVRGVDVGMTQAAVDADENLARPRLGSIGP